jgi:hypothetical protein
VQVQHPKNKEFADLPMVRDLGCTVYCIAKSRNPGKRRCYGGPVSVMLYICISKIVQRKLFQMFSKVANDPYYSLVWFIHATLDSSLPRTPKCYYRMDTVLYGLYDVVES